MLAPMLVLLVLLVLWAGRAGHAGLMADLAAAEAATAAAMCCEEGDAERRERVAEKVLEVDDARASEGDRFATFDVWLHQPGAADVSVSWWVVAQVGQAAAGVDYAISSGVATVFPGDRAAEVRVPLIDDTLDEPDETFLLVLGNPSGASLDRPAAVGTIVDDD